MKRGTAMILWTIRTGVRTTRGKADTTIQAWEETVDSAVTMLRDAADGQPVQITVESSPAHLYPAIDERGQFDDLATRAGAQRLLSEIRRELNS